MKRSDYADLLLLSALWGASFLFMRTTAPHFGPLAMAALRVAGAAAMLVPLLWLRGDLRALRSHAGPLLVVGLTNSALPFALFGFAALHLTGGLAAIFNAATPLFGALIAWVWLRDRMAGWRVIGLMIGFAGVAQLALANARGAQPGGPLWAVVACLVAPMLYALAANFTKKHLAGVPSLTVAAGSQLGAALILAFPAALTWPDLTPPAAAWAMLAALAVLCTGLAYILYFRLIAHAGAANAMTVTFLAPPFAMLWGAVFLDEAVTLAMLLGGAAILAGTALATGLLPRRPQPADGSPDQ